MALYTITYISNIPTFGLVTNAEVISSLTDTDAEKLTVSYVREVHAGLYQYLKERGLQGVPIARLTQPGVHFGLDIFGTYYQFILASLASTSSFDPYQAGIRLTYQTASTNQMFISGLATFNQLKALRATAIVVQRPNTSYICEGSNSSQLRPHFESKKAKLHPQTATLGAGTRTSRPAPPRDLSAL
ncbi:hypothetical protein BX616_007104 [Lobosporangium transversale]|uniref:Uncharacterized protein n=1 Tax=Lobosporangium transversale TaxID=64571 RepID=A0A1Y2GSQ6_9FUNG|nr:hypothetical protein BCR41DRAFT_394592 [Lobosporangium transversale]KAF9915016.1 hypothetical protein BX616_007104 [Lobosporangium transversale]ORZ21825.1 hypothetical protein BCR41DRAFT_394592 [Lobosporangium transversale]|eukprot:XP_021883076.1 hypothetical protein BCR41DRAFT_394592 [Lobosporangium transversale]